MPTPAGQAPRPLDVLVVDPGAIGPDVRRAFSHGARACGDQRRQRRARDCGSPSQTSFDAVLCDARLVDRDGIPIAAALRAHDGLRRRALRAVGTDAARRARLARRHSKDATVVTRPYDVEELRRLIEGD